MSEKKRILVIKIGSSVIMTKRNKFDEFRMAHIADQIVSLQSLGMSVVLIISGAVACGVNIFMNLDTLHTNTSDSMKMCENNIFKRAVAGIGQGYLISELLKIFGQKKLKLAQILLTKDYLQSQEAKNSLLQTLNFYMKNGVIPIFNENDVLELNSFGGNDFLAAEITMLLKADELFILSTLEGSLFGVGGSKSKLEAVSLLTCRNIKASILNGKTKNILLETLL